MCFSNASRPRRANWLARCRASSSHSCSETTVREAPSPTRISTFSLRRASPCRRARRAPRLFGAASMTVCAARGALPRPRAGDDGDLLVFAGDRDEQRLLEGGPGVGARALLGDAGRCRCGRRRAVDPRDRDARDIRRSRSVGASRRARRRSGRRRSRPGDSFHSCSRPLTGGNSSTFTERNRSERVCTGTNAPSECATSPCCSAVGMAVLFIWAVILADRCLPCPSR